MVNLLYHLSSGIATGIRNFIMSNNCDLIVKDVDFEDYKLKSAQDRESKTIYVAVRWVCNGIGLSRGQMNNESVRIKEDLVLSKGARNLVLPTDGGKQDILCIDIEYLPLWLAKISITPKMKKDSPTVVAKLVDYQLKAKDVLARAFLYGEFDLPKNYHEALQQLLLMDEKNNELQFENNRMKPKSDQYDAFMNSHGNFSVNQVANMLGQGEYIFFAMLRDSKILRYENGDNVPYGRFRKSGHFIEVATVDPRGFNHTKTYVTPKGVTYLCKRFKLSLVKGVVA